MKNLDDVSGFSLQRQTLALLALRFFKCTSMKALPTCLIKFFVGLAILALPFLIGRALFFEPVTNMVASTAKVLGPTDAAFKINSAVQSNAYFRQLRSHSTYSLNDKEDIGSNIDLHEAYRMAKGEEFELPKAKSKSKVTVEEEGKNTPNNLAID